MRRVDYLIVGSGLTGAVIARVLADTGRDVLVVERRPHVGGNVHDSEHPSGIRIHTYGPHYFRTSSERVWEFATRFAPFYRYEASVLSLVDGEFERWPVAAEYIRRHVGDGWRPAFTGTPSNLEQAALSLMPRLVYEKFVKEYNEKQWGVPASTLSAGLCRRFDVRHDGEARLTPTARYQGLPEPGYTEWMRRILAGVPVMRDHDFLLRRGEVEPRRLLIYTGPIDAFFGYDLGRLRYRGQRRQHRYIPDQVYAQPCGQVNNPAKVGGSHIRQLEWKHMMRSDEARKIQGTVVTRETPFSPSEPDQFEYPFPDRQNARLYESYRARTAWQQGVLICGRLGEYRYYDMDQAIGRALHLAGRIVRMSAETRRGRDLIGRRWGGE